MFEITITGESMSGLASNILALASQFQTTASYEADNAVREELQAKRTRATKPKADPKIEPEEEVNIDASQADAELRAAIAADERSVQPMPETAKAVVDAGTGRVAEPADAPIKMTMDDVKAAAAKLAAADTPKLASILKKYKAGKLSEVPPAKLADFASDVMSTLEQLEALS